MRLWIISSRIQGSAEGVTPQGVADRTTKHFPGGGARENGFDPHYAAGQWNVYATEGSLQKYHIPALKAAVKNQYVIYYAVLFKAVSREERTAEGL